jgi:hypothetical protein
MQVVPFIAAALLIAGAAAPTFAADAVKPGATAAAYKEIPWEDLVPKDWDPMKITSDPKLGAVQDGSLQALRMMRELREAWDNAPTVAKLNGAAVKLPGYVVPLESVNGELKEFLLVPYFGACIHSPPPPANQIIHVVLDKPAKGLRAMDAVWASGTLKTERGNSDMGTSGYRMQAQSVKLYETPASR